jgi:DNA-binding winged helix-turn-helix (wHTH) protein
MPEAKIMAKGIVTRPIDISAAFLLNDWLLFVVGEFTLEDINDANRKVSLKPVTARVLSLLAREPNRVFHRRELLDEGWRAFGFEVGENSLNQVISSLRTAFSELDPKRPYIRTIPRIGYALTADSQAVSYDAVRRAAESAEEATDTVNPTDTLLGEIDPVHRAIPLTMFTLRVEQHHDISDLYGQDVGAALLTAVSDCIRKNLRRRGDTVAIRHDGVFVIRLDNTDGVGAAHVARKIDRSIRDLEWKGPDGVRLAISASIDFAPGTRATGHGNR